MTNESPALPATAATAAPAAAPRARLHPLFATAAVSVIVLATAGVATMTGLIGSPRAGSPGTSAVAQPGDASAPPSANGGPTASAASSGERTSAVATHAPRAATAHASAQAPRHAPAPAHAETRPTAVAAASEPAPSLRTRAPARSEAKPANSGPGWATVSEVRTVERPAKASGLGAIGGAIAGGALGHQVGEGKGNTAATVVGLLGGAVAGHQIERRMRTERFVEVTLGGDDGTRQTVAFAHDPGWHEGDRIRIADAVAAERRDPAHKAEDASSGDGVRGPD